MASAVVETFLGVSGLTLTVDLYPLGSDTIAVNGMTMTEATNRKGLYTGTTTAAVTGEHQAFVKSGSTVVGTGYVQMDNTTSLHRIVDNAADASKDIGGTSSNIGAINSVVTTSVTTVNANVGTTQPVNFTGTGASALAKSDMVDIAGAAVDTTAAQIGANLVTVKAQTVTCAAGTTIGAFVGNATAALGVDASGRVDLGKILGTASAGAVGYVGIDWGHVNAPTTTVGLTNTTIASSQVVASVTGAVGSVTGAVGSVTGAVGSVTGSVGSVTAAITLPTIPANWIAAAGIAASALNGKGDWLLSSSYTAPDNSSVTAIKAKTDNLPAAPASTGDVTGVWTSAMTESYAALGGAPTPAQALSMLVSMVAEISISGTTMTCKKRDGSTTSMTFTLNDATNPTSRTRAS